MEKSTVNSLSVNEDSCSKATCTPPLRGGVSIESTFGKTGELQKEFCTAGFIARSQYGPVHYLLTAGHCVDDGQGEPGGGIGGTWESVSGEIGEALAYVHGSKQHLGSLGGTADRGDEALIYIDPSKRYAKPIEPWVIVYGNSAFGTTRNERYVINGTHFAPKEDSPEQYMVCTGGAPTRGEVTEEIEGVEERRHVEPYQAERCGVTRGFANLEHGVKHVEAFWQCDSANPEGLGKGASGSPVYKAHRAYGLYVSSTKEEAGCIGYYEGISTIEGVFHVRVINVG